ncbi:MAG TPA: MarR family winged helix-turn-helix transcriptional regulator [Burkholderiales bacterium]|nr:MarR family winged helix-turn-helix transcriptional regulator [Burkholderiales bacterium]
MAQIKPAGDGKPAAAGCTCFKLRRLTRRVTAVYDRALSVAGMRVTQYSLLGHLRGLRGVPMSELAEMLDMDRTTLTRNLRPLLEAGWVEVRASDEDARVRLVQLTSAGEERWRAARTCWRQAQDEVSATIGADRLAALHQMLESAVPLFRPVTGNEGDSE